MSNQWLRYLCIANPLGDLCKADPRRKQQLTRLSRPTDIPSPPWPVNCPGNSGDQFGVGTIKPNPTVPRLSRNVQIVLAITSELQRVSMTITTDNGRFHSSNRIEINHVLGDRVQRLRSRHDLERLDDFILRDIGLSRGESRSGVPKQFWFNS